jgi:hypothetical protein
VTHARLRAEQGDAEGARFLARQVLALRPDDPDARGLLDRLSEPEDGPAAARERLVDWIERVRRNRTLGAR